MVCKHGHMGEDEDKAAKKPNGFYQLPDDFDGDQGDEWHMSKTHVQWGEELLTLR